MGLQVLYLFSISSSVIVIYILFLLLRYRVTNNIANIDHKFTIS